MNQEKELADLKYHLLRQEGQIYGLHALTTALFQGLPTAQRKTVLTSFEHKCETFAALMLGDDSSDSEVMFQALQDFRESVLAG